MGTLKDREKYPHLLPEENRILKAWFQVYEDEFDRFEFDVHVGQGRPVPPSMRPPFDKMVPALTQKRIDLIGFTPYAVYIFDVTPQATFRHLGQLIAYELFYKEEFKPTRPIRLGVICEYIDPDVERMFKEHKIAIFVGTREAIT